MKVAAIKAMLEDTRISKPCTKQSVQAAIVSLKNEIVYGDNAIRNDVPVCPRAEQNLPTGVGYELCKSVCNQNEHAEVTAIQNAKEKGICIQGATLYLIGHTYCCDNCKAAMKEAGIVKAICIDSDLELDLTA